MMRGTNKFLGLALALGFTSAAFSQVTINLPGPTQHFDAAGDSSNTVVTGVATTPSTFILSDQVTPASGTIEVLIDGSFGSEARFRLRNSAYPTDFADLQLFDFGISFTSGPVADDFVVPTVLTGPLVGKSIPAGSTWSVEAFDIFDDGADLSDGQSSNVSFTLNVFTPPTPPVTVADLGSFADGTVGTRTDTYAANEIKWFKFTLPDAVSAANFKYLDLDTEGSASSDTEFGLYNANGFRVANDDDSGSGNLSQLTFGAGPAARPAVGNGSAYNGRNGNLDPGTYYLAVGNWNVNFNASGFSVVGTTGPAGDITINWRKQQGSAPVAPTAVDLGTLADATLPVQISNHAIAEVKWYKFTLAENIDLASGKFLDIDTETTTAFADTEIALFNSTGGIVTSDNDDGSGALSQLTFGPGGFTRPAVGTGSTYNGRDGSLNAGVYYLAVSGFDLNIAAGWVATSNSTITGAIRTNIRKGVGVPPPPPSVFTDLGTLVDPGTVSNTQVFGPGEVKWYRFVLPVAADAISGNYLDIDTLGTSSFISASTFADNDTELALFSNTGTLLFADDDSGQDFLSLITCGSGAGNRGAQGTNGSNYDGLDAQLAPGTYWVAVGGFNSVFGNGWSVSSTSDHSGPITTNFRLNAAVTVATITGTVTLSDYTGDWAQEDVEVLVYNGSTQMASTIVSLDAAGAYTANLFGMADGTYDVYMKGRTFLRKLNAGITVSGGAGTCDVTLINGDVNGDDEIGAADFSDLAAAYDAVTGDPNFDANADLNGDGEVGAADFSILAANYDATGDPLP